MMSLTSIWMKVADPYVATNAIEIQRSFDLKAWCFPLRKIYHVVVQSFLYLLICLNRTELFSRGHSEFLKTSTPPSSEIMASICVLYSRLGS